MVSSSARIPPRSTRYWCSVAAGKRGRVGELALLATRGRVSSSRGPFGAKRGDVTTHRGGVAVSWRRGSSPRGRASRASGTRARAETRSIQRPARRGRLSVTAYTFLSGRPCWRTA